MKKESNLMLYALLLILFTAVLHTGSLKVYAAAKAKQAKKQKITIQKKQTAAVRRLKHRKSSRSFSLRSTNAELLDWWTSASKLFARGDEAAIYDIRTGKTFTVIRTMGTNHADVEAKTSQDTKVIKEIWNGFSWDRRPVLVLINGRRLAASMTGMPHAGIDSQPAYTQVENRSDGYGSGLNLDVIKDNGMDGHMDIHFLNSTRHKDGKIDPEHQAAVLAAAGR